MTTEQPATAPGRRSRVLGMTTQTAGVVGIVVSLVMIVVVILGRGWLVDRVDSVSGRIDDGLAKGVPLLDTASGRVSEVSGRVGVVVDALEARAADPGSAPELVQAVLARATEASDRYLAFRTSYAEAREKVVSVLDRLDAIDQLVPAITVPQGPVDTLATLDEKMRTLDENLMELINAIPEAGQGQVATAVAEKAAKVETALAAASAGLDEAEVRLNELRTEVAGWADTINTVITIATIVLVLAFLYSALLHWVLYRTGAQMRRSDKDG